MRSSLAVLAVGSLVISVVSGCGGGSGGGAPGGQQAPLVNYLGTTGVFVAWADAASGGFASAPMGSYAGKKQILHGSVDFLTGTSLSQAAGVEIYKGSDGHI